MGAETTRANLLHQLRLETTAETKFTELNDALREYYVV